MKRNVVYQTDQLVRYFARNRVAWPQFYESERAIISRLDLDSKQSVLDIGCGCGGLGLALRERFGVEDYTGVEINEAAAQAGRLLNPAAQILCGDILDLTESDLLERRFNAVFSLSCVDWNVRFAAMLAAAWNHVLPGGHLIATFRLIDTQGCNDPERSYQYINFDGVLEGERAAYVVLCARELLQELMAFDPSEIRAYGYWGEPSVTAVTPYKRLCFSAFSIRKRNGDTRTPQFDLDLPIEILDVMDLP
jgi:SAM-dependent methyltransferase